MSTAACYVLHYGAEWLNWSMRSVRDLVDDIFVFYSPTPSHGHSTAMVCPESRDALYTMARLHRAFWHDCGPFGWEGQHRDFAYGKLQEAGYDQILVVDADELWDPEMLYPLLKDAAKMEERNVCVGARHFWRSLKWICDDQCAPVRIINTKKQGGTKYYPLDSAKFLHMGYAQSSRIIKYKMDIHGHKGEIRPNWFENIFLKWRPGVIDVHPTNDKNFWEPRPFVDDGTLLYLANDHPYWGKDIIE